MPSGSWFCDGCLTDQANRILEFLNQTRRVLANRSSTTVTVGEDGEGDEELQEATDAEHSASEAEPEAASMVAPVVNARGAEENDAVVEDTVKDGEETAKDAEKLGSTSDPSVLSDSVQPLTDTQVVDTLAPVSCCHCKPTCPGLSGTHTDTFSE